MTRKSYKNLLQEVCYRDKCIIDFDKIEKYNREIKVDFICNCGNEYCRTIRRLCDSVGGFCEKCTKNKRNEKVKQTCIERYGEKYTKYTRQGLIDACNRDKCIIDFDKLEKCNRNTKIKFICNCGIEYSKTFRQIYDISGGFCKICTKNKTKEKVKQTCQDTWGVDHFTQLPEVKEKFKQTCLKNHGVNHPAQTKEFKDKVKQTNIKNYGVECVLQSPEVREKCKQTSIERCGFEYASQSNKFKEQVKKTNNIKLGVDYPMQSKKVMDKSKQTCLLNYGVEHPSQTQEFQDRVKQTNMKKYGVKHILQSQVFQKQFKQTCLSNNGTEYPMQSQKIKDKSKQTSLKNYGVEYPMQNAEFSEKVSKNAYNLKEFNFPCGNTIQVQGYEPFLLKNLIEEGYTYEDIIVKRTEVPKIWYDKDNNKHRYYCDIYIPKINTIYEVKSTWTYKKDIDDIPLKKQACIDTGYLFELYVYDGKGIRQEI